MIAHEGASVRLPPQNTEAEHCVLGAMLLDREAIGEVLMVLDADDFYQPQHAEVYRALVELYDRNAPVDLVLVKNELEQAGRLEAVGGVAFLVGLMESVPDSRHVVAYSRLVRDAAERRRLVEAAQQILREVHDGTQRPASELIESAEQRVFAVAHRRGEEEVESMQTLIRKALLRIEALQASEGETTRGLRTHFADLDRKLNGLAPGALYVIAGRPSMGKTSFALNILEHIAVRDGLPALLFTLEVTREQVAENMLCSNARVDAQRLMRGELSEDEYLKVPEAAGRLAAAPLYIDDTPSLSISRLRAKARRIHARQKLGLIVVDYLQLLTLGENAESRQVEISRLSAALKHMARELSVPVIALSQLNRSVESRQDKRPLMGDLRESGSIEQDADAILLLYREEYYNKEKLEARGKAEVILAKNRSGPTGTVELFFFPNMMRFENPTFLPDPAGAGAGGGGSAW